MCSYHASVQSHTKESMLRKVSMWMYTDWLSYKWLYASQCNTQCNTRLSINVFQIDIYALFHNLLCFNMVPGKKWNVLYVLFIRSFYDCNLTHARLATGISICFQVSPWKMLWNTSQSPSPSRTTAYLLFIQKSITDISQGARRSKLDNWGEGKLILHFKCS